MKTLRYVGKHDEVFVPDAVQTVTETDDAGTTYTRTVDGVVVKHGETADFADELAGDPPTGVHGQPGYDAGSGLLAQTDNWELATGTTATKTDVAAQPPVAEPVAEATPAEEV